MKKRVLISVSDKTGIVEFAKKLVEQSFEIISTGGTFKTLSEAGIEVIKVSDITGFPEIMDGRVKTLHPKIHGGILANRENQNHMKQAEELDITMLDMVVVNLYPFERTVKNPESSHELIIENIDIGGPTMVRASAKNYKDVVIVTSSDDYDWVISDLLDHGEVSIDTRQYLAAKAFAHTANYDRMISAYFSKFLEEEHPAYVQISLPEKEILRYGENPHQKADFYSHPDNHMIHQLHGKRLSYNNYLDMDSALKIIEKFWDSEPTVAIIKHTNPSGIGTATNLKEAYDKAFATDKLSPFGGIVIVNKTLDLSSAERINEVFTEIILAPEFTENALTKLKKKKNRRLITFDINKVKKLKDNRTHKTCMAGILTQDLDMGMDNYDDWKVVTDRKPTETEIEALKFGWKTVATLKSNAVCFTTNDRTLGLGIGQTSRIDSTEIAIAKAAKFELSLENSICASDAFFPFRDSVDALAKHGIKAIIQPGGSKGDPEVIEACNEHGIAMIFTGMRHFRH